MSYSSLGIHPGAQLVKDTYPILTGVTNALPTDLPAIKPGDGWAAQTMVVIASLVPAAIVGAFVGSYCADVTPKQRHYAQLGGLAGAGLAAVMLMLAYVRSQNEDAPPPPAAPAPQGA